MNSKNPYSEIDFDSDYAYDSSAGGSDITVEQFTDNSEVSVSSLLTQIVDKSIATIGTLPQELALLTTVLGLPATHAIAADNVVCVSTAADLQAALLNAPTNGMADVIKLVQGIYTGNFSYSDQSTTVADNYALTIQGGFTGGCTSRVLNPINTVLDGNHSTTPLTISKRGNTNVTVEGLTMRNGQSTSRGGGLYIYSERINTTVQNCRFENNTAVSDGGGSYINNWYGAKTFLTRNVFSGNIAGNSGGGAFVAYGGNVIDANVFTNNVANYCGGLDGRYSSNVVTNNIFSGNTARGYNGQNNGRGGGACSRYNSDVINNTFNNNNAAYGGGLYLELPYDSADFSGDLIANNLFWANISSAGQGADLYLLNDLDDDGIPTAVNLIANDFDQTPSGFYSDVSITIPGSNLNRVNPLFISSNDLHLSAASPVINKGDKTVANLPIADFDGGQRVMGINVDIGADEYIIVDAPIATTNAPSVVTASSARLSGTVAPNGAVTTASFDFGATTNYGANIAATPSSIAAAAATTSISADKTGLACARPYHYRVKAVNSFGTSYGADKAFTTGVCPITDLSLTLSDGKGSVIAGDTLSYTAVVRNNGPTAANTAVIKAPAVANLTVNSVSCGTPIGGATCPASPTVAALQGTGLIIPTLPVGGGVTFTINARVAATAPSSNLAYTATVTAPVVTVVDNNVANNTAKDVDRIVSRPDFIVTAIAITPPVPMAGSTFSATVTVKNQGGVASNGGVLGLWLNQPLEQNCRATADTQAIVGTVAAGATKVLTFNGLTAPTSGNKILRAFVDNTCATAETNESNNQAIKDYAIGGTYDLVVTAIAVTPASPAANGTFNAVVTVKNQGTASADGGFLDVWANKTTNATCGSDSDAWVDVGILAAGATKNLTATGLTAGTAGNKTLRALVDSWCEIAETNELNNQFTKVYTVR